MFRKTLLSLSFALIASTSAQAIHLNAESYYIMESETGTAVLEKNADKQLSPASLTKMMTAYIIFEALERGDLTMETMMPISEKAWRKGGSKMFLEVGKKVKTEDLIKGILVSSGNDACIVAAEFLAGTEDAFAMQMTDKALELGMLNTIFKNASGWPDPQQVSTAKDMAILAHSIVKNFPQYYEYFNIQRFSYSGISQPNRNGLLRRNVGVDGMKTGHVEEAGYHLVASAQKKGVRLISAVMGTNSSRSREDETLTGISYAFRTHSMVNAVEENKIVVDNAAVTLGEKETASLMVGDSLKLYISNKDKKKLKGEAVYESPLKAPLVKGDVIGQFIVTHPSTDEKIELPLMVAENIEEAGFVNKFFTYIQRGLGF